MTAPEMRPVVVGVDGSSSAVQAARWAATEAARRKAPLSITHACMLIPVRMPPGVELPRPYADALTEQGREVLAAAAEAAREAAPEVGVTTELRGGAAAEHLIGRSASADLIVLGSRGLGGFTGLLVGSIAVAVATHGHCPVVVVRGADRPQDAPVVVGVDGSPTSDAALAFAFDAAATRGTRLVAVRAWSDFAVGNAWAFGSALDWETVQAAEARLVDQQLGTYRSKYPDVPVESVVVRDRPAHTLLEHSENAQLVVVGSRGRGGFRGLLLGSTSQALIHHSASPVAVVPPARQ
ncbi:universal stress protein [Amycolatopsis sp. NPDC058340]|uniref:universal stress protein n=1 Tax=Amycolatopsis sp. NPDC058340 TaxID=3346453 RepID=UPI00365E1CA2